MATHFALDVGDATFSYELLARASRRGSGARRQLHRARVRSAGALRKIYTHTLDDGTPAHSFATLLADLGTITRSTCRRRDAAVDDTFEPLTTPTAAQHRAFDLLKTIAV